MSEITNAERLDRLEHAERFLRGWKKYTKYCVKPVKSFDMCSFYCGTAACAAGGMALHPWFIERGFTLDRILRVGFFSSYSNCAAFFAISHTEAAECFSPGAYDQDDDAITPPMVADKIHALIVKYRKVKA